MGAMKMTCIIPQKAKAFDEEKFLKECVQIFSDIREKYQLDEQTLNSTDWLHRKGYTANETGAGF